MKGLGGNFPITLPSRMNSTPTAAGTSRRPAQDRPSVGPMTTKSTGTVMTIGSAQRIA